MRFTNRPYQMSTGELTDHIADLSRFIEEYKGDLWNLHILTQRRYRCQKELERREAPTKSGATHYKKSGKNNKEEI